MVEDRHDAAGSESSERYPSNSAGNEIDDTPKTEVANQILRGQIDVFHENDSTRPDTQALSRPNVSHDYDNGLADLLEVVGKTIVRHVAGDAGSSGVLGRIIPGKRGTGRWLGRLRG